MVAYGMCTLAKKGDLELKSEYEDDIAFFYGKDRLYFKRYIARAFNEARASLNRYCRYHNILVAPKIENPTNHDTVGFFIT
jgi:hypothetical protein